MVLHKSLMDLQEIKALGKRGDIVGIAIGVIATIIVIGIGMLIVLYTKSVLPTGLLATADNATLQAFLANLESVYQFFVVVVLVMMAGVIILVLRSFSGGGLRMG